MNNLQCFLLNGYDEYNNMIMYGGANTTTSPAHKTRKGRISLIYGKTTESPLSFNQRVAFAQRIFGTNRPGDAPFGLAPPSFKIKKHNNNSNSQSVSQGNEVLIDNIVRKLVGIDDDDRRKKLSQRWDQTIDKLNIILTESGFDTPSSMNLLHDMKISKLVEDKKKESREIDKLKREKAGLMAALAKPRSKVT